MSEWIVSDADLGCDGAYFSYTELIRCKDCEYYHPSYCEVWSRYGTVQTREGGFCFMAERRTDGSD